MMMKHVVLVKYYAHLAIVSWVREIESIFERKRMKWEAPEEKETEVWGKKGKNKKRNITSSEFSSLSFDSIHSSSSLIFSRF